MSGKEKDLLEYLKVVSTMYFEGDPLEVQPTIKRIMFLLEMELNEKHKTEMGK